MRMRERIVPARGRRQAEKRSPLHPTGRRQARPVVRALRQNRINPDTQGEGEPMKKRTMYIRAQRKKQPKVFKTTNLLCLVLLLLLLIAGVARAQGYSSQIKELEKELYELKLQGGDLFAEDAYNLAEKNISSAQKALDKGNTAEIESMLRTAKGAMAEAARVTDQSREFFADALEARADCEPVQAALTHSPKAWLKGESLFRKAVRARDKGKTAEAKALAKEAEVYFREAELYAIQMVITQDARITIHDAKKIGAEKFAPRTLALAEEYVEKTFDAVEKDRYDREGSSSLASEALYQAQWAFYIAKWAQDHRKQKDGYEVTWIEIDSAMTRIGREVNYRPYFDQGLEPPTDGIIEQIGGLFYEVRRLEGMNDSLFTLVDSLRMALDLANAELASWRKQYGELESEFASEMEQKRLAEEIRKEQQMRIKRLRELLSEQEADILIDGRDIIIRLIGLQFASGKDEIPTDTYSLMGRVITALEEFPDKRVDVEGHTDSRGGQKANQKLSERRAHSVRDYLISNSKTINPRRVTAIGHGESKPIATNETREGRGKNRRLEIIVKNVVRSVSE
ncbi:OmpA family protein [bacterium]|nr:OmpA family protein [bacterium]